MEEKLQLLRKGQSLMWDVKYRLTMLKSLRAAIEAHEGALLSALRDDLNKAPQEVYMTEVGLVKDEIRCALRHLRRWARPRRVKAPISLFPARGRILREPRGVVLIMSPWNYPVLLTLSPLVGAIAGGNSVMVKPSAYAPRCALVISDILREAFPESVCGCVLGGRAENQALLHQTFDYVFFTGSVNVGKEVMRCCAEHLTPVTLELGGKSPCIICGDTDLALAARRIAWAKIVNAGQTCVAPDYVLVPAGLRDEFITAVRREWRRLLGDDPLSNPDYPKIISPKHFQRVQRLLPEGARVDEGKCQVAPAVFPADRTHPAMGEEIFAPLLPVLTYESEAALRDELAALPRPLALYLFTDRAESRHLFLDTLSFGGGCVNDCLMHLATHFMPFGGSGDSGMGGYHGKWSFDTFTREKSVLLRGHLDLPMRYPPYTKKKLSLIQKLL